MRHVFQCMMVSLQLHDTLIVISQSAPNVSLGSDITIDCNSILALDELYHIKPTQAPTNYYMQTLFLG